MEDLSKLYNYKNVAWVRDAYRQEFRRLKGTDSWEKIDMQDIKSGDVIDVTEFVNENFVAGSVHKATSDYYINKEGAGSFKCDLITRYY